MNPMHDNCVYLILLSNFSHKFTYYDIIYYILIYRLETILRNCGWKRVITTEEYASSLQKVPTMSFLTLCSL